MPYLVGDPANGPFANLAAKTEEEAREEAGKYGKVVDEMDWTDDFGKPTILFIVQD